MVSGKNCVRTPLNIKFVRNNFSIVVSTINGNIQKYISTIGMR